MEIIVKGDPKEIAALVSLLQERQKMDRITGENLSGAIHDILLEFAESTEKRLRPAEK